VEVEAFQLDLLRGLGIPVPRVYQCHVASLDNPNSYLLMEYVDGITLSEAKKKLTSEEFDGLEQELADLTAALHQQTREQYGKVDASGNHQTADWPGFYRSLHDQAVQTTNGVKDIPVKTRKKIEKLHDRLDRYLAHTDRPRLLHGDLWSANVMCRQDGDGKWKVAAVLDPNLRYGHAESELAYLELFETCNPAFKKTYQRTHKLDDDYHKIRKPIYQLYPMIDHVHLFGKKYVEPLMKVAERATAVM
jgi:fructosamine-3-kinase